MKYLFILFLINVRIVFAQTNNSITDSTIIHYGHYDIYIDSTGMATIETISQLPDYKFIPESVVNWHTQPKTHYWLRFKINDLSSKAFVIETPKEYRISELYSPQNGRFIKNVYDIYKLWERNRFIFNKPTFTLPTNIGKDYFYLHLCSDISLGLGFVIYDSEFAHNKAIEKFTQIFFISGVLFLAIIYALVFFLRLKDKAFVYYLCYLICLLIFSLTQFGIILPLLKWFDYNHYFLTLPYAGMTISLLLYVDKTLFLKQKLPLFHKLIFAIIICRLILLVIGSLPCYEAFNETLIDYICLLPAYIATFIEVRKKANYSRLLFISLTILFVAFSIRAVFKAYVPISIYEHGQDNDILFYIFTIVEVIFLSFTLTERYLHLKKMKELADKETIQYQQLALEEAKEKEELKEMLNKELETMVAHRTRELDFAYNKLQEQAFSIEEMNKILQVDNEKLSNQVALANNARLLDKNMKYAEFSELFQDDLTCYGFVAGLKWKNEFECKKCGYKKFYIGATPHSRQCKLCKYSESATANTIFDNTKFSLQKAMYILYYTYSFPAHNIHKLSEELDMREGTCHAFYKKILGVIQKLKPSVRSAMDWTKMILVMAE